MTFINPRNRSGVSCQCKVKQINNRRKTQHVLILLLWLKHGVSGHMFLAKIPTVASYAGVYIHAVHTRRRRSCLCLHAPGSCWVHQTRERDTEGWLFKIIQMLQYMKNKNISEDFNLSYFNVMFAPTTLQAWRLQWIFSLETWREQRLCNSNRTAESSRHLDDAGQAARGHVMFLFRGCCRHPLGGKKNSLHPKSGE